MGDKLEQKKPPEYGLVIYDMPVLIVCHKALTLKGKEGRKGKKQRLLTYRVKSSSHWLHMIGRKLVKLIGTWSLNQ